MKNAISKFKIRQALRAFTTQCEHRRILYRFVEPFNQLGFQLVVSLIGGLISVLKRIMH
jgi:hypothetical protein